MSIAQKHNWQKIKYAIAWGHTDRNTIYVGCLACPVCSKHTTLSVSKTKVKVALSHCS